MNIAFTRKLSSGDKTINAKDMIIETLQSNIFSPDLQTYTAAIQHCYSQSRCKDGLDIFDIIIDKKILPDRLVYGMTLSCCIQENNHIKAKDIFDRANKQFRFGSSQEHLLEDTCIYSGIIFAKESVGHFERVLYYFDELKTHGIKPSAGIINSALRASMKLQNWMKFSEVKMMLSLFNRTQIPQQYLLKPPVPPIALNALGCLKSLKECSQLLLLSKSEDDISDAIYRVSGESPLGSDDISISLKLQSQLDDILQEKHFMIKSKLRRRIIHLQQQLSQGPRAMDCTTIVPTHSIYGTLFESAGLRLNASLAFVFLKEALRQESFVPDREMYRKLIECCVKANDKVLTSKARALLEAAQGSLKLSLNTEDMYAAVVPNAFFIGINEGREIHVRNGIGIYSRATKQLLQAMQSRIPSFDLNPNALPERGRQMPSIDRAKEILLYHAEKQALAGGLVANKVFPKVSVNLCMCDDCHAFFKAASVAFNVTLYCQDPSKLHEFQGGECSCRNFWGAR